MPYRSPAMAYRRRTTPPPMKHPFRKALAGAVIDGVAIALTYFYAPDWAFNLAIVLMAVPGCFAFIGAIEWASLSPKQRRELKDSRPSQRTPTTWTWRYVLLAAAVIIPSLGGIPLIAIGLARHLHALTITGIVFVVIGALENLILPPVLHARRSRRNLAAEPSGR